MHGAPTTITQRRDASRSLVCCRGTKMCESGSPIQSECRHTPTFGPSLLQLNVLASAFGRDACRVLQLRHGLIDGIRPGPRNRSCRQTKFSNNAVGWSTGKCSRRRGARAESPQTWAILFTRRPFTGSTPFAKIVGLVAHILQQCLPKLGSIRVE